MKLFFCPTCEDIVKMLSVRRSCRCGKSSGRYVSDTHAEVSGDAIPIGIKNSGFERAIRDRSPHDEIPFDAFVIPTGSPRVRYV